MYKFSPTYCSIWILREIKKYLINLKKVNYPFHDDLVAFVCVSVCVFLKYLDSSDFICKLTNLSTGAFTACLVYI